MLKVFSLNIECVKGKCPYIKEKWHWWKCKQLTNGKEIYKQLVYLYLIITIFHWLRKYLMNSSHVQRSAISLVNSWSQSPAIKDLVILYKSRFFCSNHKCRLFIELLARLKYHSQKMSRDQGKQGSQKNRPKSLQTFLAEVPLLPDSWRLSLTVTLGSQHLIATAALETGCHCCHHHQHHTGSSLVGNSTSPTFDKVPGGCVSSAQPRSCARPQLHGRQSKHQLRIWQWKDLSKIYRIR